MSILHCSSGNSCNFEPRTRPKKPPMVWIGISKVLGYRFLPNRQPYIKYALYSNIGQGQRLTSTITTVPYTGLKMPSLSPSYFPVSLSCWTQPWMQSLILAFQSTARFSIIQGAWSRNSLVGQRHLSCSLGSIQILSRTVSFRTSRSKMC